MNARLLVCPGLRATVSALVGEGRLAAEIVEEKPFGICIRTASNRRQCRVDSLYAGGWIACSTAWEIAKKHGLSLRQLGDLFEALNVRVRRCSLGCFE